MLSKQRPTKTKVDFSVSLTLFLIGLLDGKSATIGSGPTCSVSWCLLLWIGCGLNHFTGLTLFPGPELRSFPNHSEVWSWISKILTEWIKKRKPGYKLVPVITVISHPSILGFFNMNQTKTTLKLVKLVNLVGGWNHAHVSNQNEGAWHLWNSGEEQNQWSFSVPEPSIV